MNVTFFGSRVFAHIELKMGSSGGAPSQSAWCAYHRRSTDIRQLQEGEHHARQAETETPELHARSSRWLAPGRSQEEAKKDTLPLTQVLEGPHGTSIF